MDHPTQSKQPLGPYIFQMLDFADLMYDVARGDDGYMAQGAFKAMVYIESILDNPGRSWAQDLPEGVMSRSDALKHATTRMDLLRDKVEELANTGNFDETIKHLARTYDQWARGLKLL